MKSEKESPPIDGIISEEIADTLTAISVVAKKLATDIRKKTKETTEKWKQNW